jgi:hypothetical protein
MPDTGPVSAQLTARRRGRTRAHGLEILHYDRDFDTVACFTEQPARWIVSPGRALTTPAAGR